MRKLASYCACTAARNRVAGFSYKKGDNAVSIQHPPTRTLPQELIDEFIIAAHYDPARVEQLLAQYPELLYASASWEETAIQAAAQTGQRAIIEHLLSLGAPLDICTASVMGMSKEVNEMLTADPSQAHATGAHGIPVLYFAAVGGHVDIADMLLARGSEINAGQGGSTPMHGAAGFGRKEMAKWLLDHGGDINAQGYEGKTPLALAEDNGQSEMAAWLKEHGAE